jgi:hypothetical protein
VVTLNDEAMGSIPLEVAMAPGGAVEEPVQPFKD